MIRDITIGQYYPSDSIIHKLDPRVKLFATLMYIIALFCGKGIVGFAVITVFLVTTIKLSKIPFAYITKGLKGIVMLLLITTIFNLFLTPGDKTFWHFGILQVTNVGITNAIVMTIRLIFLIIGTSLMSLTTTPNQLTDGLEKSLGPLSKIHVPVHAIAMMMSIALRFIPILVEETDKIMKAQMARGADFESGNIIKKAKNMIPLRVPLMVSAFRRADELAMAMEARCYTTSDIRTKMKPLHYEKRDKIAYSIIISFVVIVIVTSIVIPFPQ